MGYAVTEILVNADTRTLVKSATQLVPPSSRPSFCAGDTMILGVHFIKGDGTDYVLHANDTFDIGVDKDFAHVLDEGTAGAGYSGTISSVAVAGLTATIPSTGHIILINGAGQADRVAYTAYSSGTFTVSATLVNTYLLGDDVQVEDELMAYADDSSVDIAGDWTSINRATGRISIRLNCNTDAFDRKITASAINGDLLSYMQIRRVPNGETAYTTMLQDTCTTKATVVGGLGGAGVTLPSYMTTTIGDARYGQLAATNTWTQTNSFAAITSTSANGVVSRAAATQDGVGLIGRAGGTSSYQVNFTPTTLTASRTITLPNADLNLSSQAANIVYAGPTTGAAAAPTFRSLVAADIPSLSYQPSDAGLTSIAALTTAADKMIYTTASDTYATTDLTSFARTVLDDTTAAAAKTTLGVGGLATTGITGDLTLTKTGTTARTVTMPDAAITVAGSASALTAGRMVNVAAGGLLQDTDISVGASDGIHSRTGSLTFTASDTVNFNSGVGSTNFTQSSISSPYPAFSIATTWNNSGVTFQAIKVDVTNTASATGAKLLDLQVGSTSQFIVRKNGAMIAGTTTLIGSEIARFAGGTAATPTSTDVTIGGGSLRSGADSYINGVRIGLGASAIASNTCVGTNALNGITTGAYNVGIGYNSLYTLSTANNNVSIGYESLYTNNAANCVGVGYRSLYSNTSGAKNIAIGEQAAGTNTTGSNNIAIGSDAGRYQSDGSTALTDAENSVYIGTGSKGLNNSDANSIVIGYNAVGKGANKVVLGNTSITENYLKGDLVLDKTTLVGIKVDYDSPTFGYRDIVGSIKTRSASTEPTFSVYNGNIYAYKFPTASGVKEVFVEFHLPHDYAQGTNVYIHTHWSQNVVDTGGTAGAPGNVKWYFDATYAKGFGTAGSTARGAFSTVVTTSVVQQGSLTQYGHMVAEVQLSSASPSGSLLDSVEMEPDGLILVRCYRDSNDAADTLNQSPFLHMIDIHYQSTNLATKAKAPDFWT